MSESKLTHVAKQMIDYALANPFQNDFTKFERILERKLRLRCYVVAEMLTLDIERQYTDLEPRESYIVRAAFHAPSRGVKTQQINSGNGWRGVRLSWNPNDKHEDEPISKQGVMFG